MSENKKNKEEDIFNFTCDCAHCPHSCGSFLEEQDEDVEEKED